MEFSPSTYIPQLQTSVRNVCGSFSVRSAGSSSYHEDLPMSLLDLRGREAHETAPRPTPTRAPIDFCPRKMLPAEFAAASVKLKARMYR